MTIIGFCTHFSLADEWAFQVALQTAMTRDWQLNICHWLASPYQIRRDMVPDDLFDPQETQPITPQLQVKLERQLREFYDPKLGDFTNVAFKLCEGQYQVEMVRCFRQNLLDVVVMGHQTAWQAQGAELPLEAFAARTNYPLILVGHNGPDSYLLNSAALEWLPAFNLPEGSWQLVQPEPAH